MKYCPHCRKPSARTSGPCPHCGNDLSQPKGAPAKPAAKPRAKPAPGARPKPADAPAGTPRPNRRSPAAKKSPSPSPKLELDTDDGGLSGGLPGSGLDLDTSEEDAPRAAAMSGLALQSLDPPSAVPMDAPVAQPGLDDLSVKQTAGFGEPGSGIIGAVKYWWKVRQRQKVLKAEMADAETRFEQATNKKLHLQAELGQRAHELGIETGTVGELISKALLAQAELKSIEKSRLNRSTAHKTKVESLGAAIELLEKKIAPTKQEEAVLMDEKRELLKQRKGVETQLRRYEIDLKNMEELIAQRQEAYADLKKPKAERDKLLADITMFDKRRPGLTAQVDALTDELHTFDAPVADLDYRIGEVRERMAPETKKIMALTNEIDQLAVKFAAEDEQTAKKLEENQQIVIEAWASAGEQVVTDKLDEPELDEQKKAVRAAMAAFAGAEDRQTLLSRAIVSYDGEAVKKGQIVVAAAAGAVLLAVVLLVVLL